MFSPKCVEELLKCYPERLRFHEVNLPGLGGVRGIQRSSLYHESYYAFENIPYGFAPKDSLRFKAAWPIKPWNYTKDCTKPGHIPVQCGKVYKDSKGNEDCLTLNIYLRNFKKGQRLPVMVFIYGEGFSSGSSYQYQPDYFMFEEVVLVTVNYRVAALGFLTLNDFELEVPGNAGLKDMVLALKWIQKYIRYFHGDTRSITLFGSEAGAGAVHLLSCSPKAKGLFHKAILQSGSMLCQWCLVPASDINYFLARASGYEGPNDDRHILAFLRLLPAEAAARWDILASNSFISGIVHPFGPTVEPYETEDAVLTTSYLPSLKNAWGNFIPMMIGGNSNESHFILGISNFTKSFFENPYEFIEEFFIPPELKSIQYLHVREALKPIIFNAYDIKRDDDPQSFFVKFLKLCDIRLFWHGVHMTIRLRDRRALKPTYQFMFDLEAIRFKLNEIHFGDLTFREGISYHNGIYFLFPKPNPDKMSCNTPEYKTIRTLIKMWTSFAKNSDPNYNLYEKYPQPNPCETVKFPFWPDLWSSCVNQTLRISYDLSFIKIPFEENLKTWNQLYSSRY